MLSFFPRGVLDEILNLIESVSEGFPSYSFKHLAVQIRNLDVDTEGSKLRWTEIRTASFYNETPDTAHIQYDHDGSVTDVNIYPNLRNNVPTLC